MANYSVNRAMDLGEDERAVLERWLGRPIAVDETISVNAWQPHPLPGQERRDILHREIIRQAREIGLRAPQAESDDTDDLLNEAFTSVRNARA